MPPISDPLDMHAPYCHTVLIGVDEVGTGCIAGPVAAGACILDTNSFASQLWARDSKSFSSMSARKQAWSKVRSESPHFVVTFTSLEEVYDMGPRRAADLAMARAVTTLLDSIHPQGDILVVVDGTRRIPMPPGINQAPVRGADHKFLCVAAASMVAKIHRDDAMIHAATEFRGYGLDANKGYGTEEHYHGLARLGTSPIHRAYALTALRRWEAKRAPEGGSPEGEVLT